MTRSSSLSIQSTRFGHLIFLPHEVITFEAGALLGFYESTFILVDPQDDTAIRWLQSTQEANLAFPLLSAAIPFLTPDRDRLKLAIDERAFYIMTIPNNVTEMTINTRAPIILNNTTMKAKQVIQDDKDNTEVNRKIYTELKTYIVSIGAN